MRSPGHSSRSWWFVLAGALALVAGACGSSSDDTGDGPTATDGPGSDDPVGEHRYVIEPDGDPVPGGDLVFGIEAETDGWDPTANRWAMAGHQVGQALFDQLATIDADGNAVPYLAESLTPNETFTVWDIKLRDGVVFHNGDPLTADAVKLVLDRHVASFLTQGAVRPIESVEVIDELTARVTMSTPWASFPVVLTTQIGYVPAPAQLNGDDAVGSPIGTGPFEMVSWDRDASLVAERNENYWREGLPYLDSVEFRIIIEGQSRADSLQSGTIDLMHTTSVGTVADFREMGAAGDLQWLEDGGLGEESFVMLNLDQPPLDDLRVRQALAYATNTEVYAQVVEDGVRQVARSPFIDSSPWYAQEAADAYPTFDPDMARALVEDYEAEKGDIVIRLATTPVPDNRKANSFLAEQWEAVGMTIELEEFLQTELINNALIGSFEANLWRQFGATDPDGEFVWWHSDNAAEIGGIALNFARNRSPEVDAALQAGREGRTFDDRKAAYDEVQLLLNQDLPYIWLTHTIWGLGANDSVRNIATSTLPDGSEGFGFGTGFAGAFRLTETWMTAG